MSDITTRCGQYTFTAHETVLCSYSNYFDRLRKSGPQEAIGNEVDISGDVPELVARLLMELYAGSYEDSDNVEDLLKASLQPDQSPADRYQNVSPSMFHVELYNIGDKLVVPALKAMAAGLFAASIQRPDPPLVEFFSATSAVYNSTTEGENTLRKLCVYQTQLAGAAARQEPRYRTLIRTNPDLASDMLLTCHKKNKVWCRRCANHVPLVGCKCG
jgi:BTB/POZ domain